MARNLAQAWFQLGNVANRALSLALLKGSMRSSKSNDRQRLNDLDSACTLCVGDAAAFLLGFGCIRSCGYYFAPCVLMLCWNQQPCRRNTLINSVEKQLITLKGQ